MITKISGLQLIINTVPNPLHPYLELALKALIGGVHSIQFRHKGNYDRKIYLLVSQLMKICDQFSVPLIINDRADIALAIQAAGVHLGRSDLPIQEARKLLGNKKIIGASASTIEQALQAEREGADYIGFGHIYPTQTKFKPHPAVGIAKLKQVCDLINIPILGIGGIDEHNLRSVCTAKISGVAIASAVNLSPTPLTQIGKIKKILDEYGK